MSGRRRFGQNVEQLRVIDERHVRRARRRRRWALRAPIEFELGVPGLVDLDRIEAETDQQIGCLQRVDHQAVGRHAADHADEVRRVSSTTPLTFGVTATGSCQASSHRRSRAALRGSKPRPTRTIGRVPSRSAPVSLPRESPDSPSSSATATCVDRAGSAAPSLIASRADSVRYAAPYGRLHARRQRRDRRHRPRSAVGDRSTTRHIGR